ncbi:hypothetical protein [Liquorilactobacillus sicerae]|uniref:hypothetical protein n=1 Tax=Liquorilactobacillus sicerae TaxID=1416943 RepID=UPI0024810DE9|nr:hypothetical protein [Liquorilactobacillus sicerae]
MDDLFYYFCESLPDTQAEKALGWLKKQLISLVKNIIVAVVNNRFFQLRNHVLAISISDVGWRSFLQKLEYKAKGQAIGKNFVMVTNETE